MDVDRYIEAVLREQAETAMSSLRTPRSRDGFEYGHACGMVQGFDRALAILESLAEQADGRARTQPQATRRLNPYTQDLDDAPRLPEQYHSVPPHNKKVR